MRLASILGVVYGASVILGRNLVLRGPGLGSVTFSSQGSDAGLGRDQEA